MTGNFERAKQFISFSALRGFEEAARAQEFMHEARVYLGEDAQLELNATLKNLEPGELITAEYYKGGRYVRVCGSLEKLDLNQRRLIIGEARIPIDDLKDIQREN